MEVKQNLSWEGQTVLSYRVTLPEGPERCRRLNRYLEKTGQVWVERWEKKLYPMACEALKTGERFRPWRAELCGEVTCLEQGLYSIRLEAREVREDGLPCLVCWGESWDLRSDGPWNVENCFRPWKGWKDRALEQILADGRAKQRENLWFPDANWEEKIKKFLKHCSPWLDEKTVFWSFPQGFIAHPAEGTPIFQTEREDIPG